MNIILNFVPLKSGGGLQVGLDFLNQLREDPVGHKWYLVATSGTPFERIKQNEAVRILQIIPNRILPRLWLEHYGCKRLVAQADAQVVYTQFGPGWPGAGVVNVSGFAYSNIVYPEINFWSYFGFFEGMKGRILDPLRRRRVKLADAVVFETELMRERALKYLGLSPERAFCVSPAGSSLVHPDVVHSEVAQRCQSIPRGYRVLMLSGLQPHKGLGLLPRIARTLVDKHKMSEIIFVITLPPHLEGTKRLLDRTDQLGVARNFYNVGPIPPEGCAELYRSCDAVILPSRLESFSNNVVEAWAMKRPLVMSDLDWARAACGDGATYFSYDKEDEAANAILRVAGDAEFRDSLIANGTRRLTQYPDSKARFLEYVRIIEDVARQRSHSTAAGQNPR
jgi:glycosyltransferase involved in cell wall biosynthesis